jgi:hypothetical protein
VLYRTAADFIFYGISFILMVTALACILNNRAVKASTDNEPVKEADDDSAKWEAIREKEDFFCPVGSSDKDTYCSHETPT